MRRGWLLAVLIVVGCTQRIRVRDTGTPTDRPGSPDAAELVDAEDANVLDAGERDALAPDVADADPRDADPRDADPSDGGFLDFGFFDALPRDANAPDATAVDAGFGPAERLHNSTSCQMPGSLRAGPGEDRHRAAVRLTPRSYPFLVTEVHIGFNTGSTGTPPDCAPNDLSKLVELFVSSSITPPATPTGVFVHSAGAGQALSPTLPIPILLNAGEHLFVAVLMHRNSSQATCINVCTNQPLTPSRNYWSHATMTPYAWGDVGSIGVPGNLDISVVGRPRP